MARITLTTGDVIEVKETKEEITKKINLNSTHIEVNKKITYFSGSYEYKVIYIMISSIIEWGD